MGQHFKLTNQEFDDNTDLFNTLEIKAEQVIGKDHQKLSTILKKQYRKLISVSHPDKGGDKNRFDQIYKAYQALEKCIIPLKSGDPCVKISVDAESDGRLTAREFHYRKKLFDTLGIGEEAIGKDFDKLTSILKKNNRYQANPGIQLSNYIAPLEKGKSLIKEDKNALSLKFIEYKYISLLIRGINTLRLVLLGIITVGCYLSWWIIAFGIICKYVSYKLVSHYYTKHKNGEISADELMSKMNYIVLGHKLLCSYPLAAFSVYLLTTNFIANGLTVGGVILGSLLAWAIFSEPLISVLLTGYEIYSEKHLKDLVEEDPRDRVQKETDLLGRYDPRKLLMPIIMPLVRKCFAKVASELAERDFDEVNTNMSDVMLTLNSHLDFKQLNLHSRILQYSINF